MQTLRRRLAGGPPEAPSGKKLIASLTVAVWPEGDQWVSQCIELDVASSGATADEAAEQATDAISAYLSALEELGERERVFAERSIPTYELPPAQHHVDLPRDIVERHGLQVRPLELPIHDSLFA